MSLTCQYGYLSLLSLQTLPEPDAGHRESDRNGRNGGSDTGKRSPSRLLPGNDLCGLSSGANLDNGNPEILLSSMTRFLEFLPGEQRQQFLSHLAQKA
jgi:hypothetical protein